MKLPCVIYWGPEALTQLITGFHSIKVKLSIVLVPSNAELHLQTEHVTRARLFLAEAR